MHAGSLECSLRETSRLFQSLCLHVLGPVALMGVNLIT